MLSLSAVARRRIGCAIALVVWLPATTAGAAILGQQSANIPAGGVIAQAFQLNANANVTVSVNPGLGAAFITWDDCHRMQTQGTPIQSVIGNAVSTSGSLTLSLSAGQYCVLVINRGPAATQASLTVSAEAR